METKTTVNRMRLLPLFLITFFGLAPMVAAFVLFFGNFHQQLEPQHNGNLLSPVIPLTHQGKPDIQDKSSLNVGQWQLVTLKATKGTSACSVSTDPATINPNNQKLEKIIQALGRESHRVKNGEVCLKPSLRQVMPKGADVASGIVDPLNNLIMIYPENASHKDIFQDIKRLLKYSKLG